MADNKTDTKEKKRILVVINPSAGVERPILHPLARAWSGRAKWEVAITHAGGEARKICKEAAGSNEWDLVAVYGGDGTVMEAACGLKGGNIPMLILPGGTANVMAAELRISDDLEVSASLALGNFRTRMVDLGWINDHPFLLRAAFGLEAEMMRQTEREAKSQFGRLAYGWTALQQLMTTEPQTYRVKIDEESFEARGHNCMVANSGNLGVSGVGLADEIQIDDGLLDLVIFPESSFADLIQRIASGLTQNFQLLSSLGVIHKQGKQVAVELVDADFGTVDGEIFEGKKWEASVEESALQVICPQTT